MTYKCNNGVYHFLYSIFSSINTDAYCVTEPVLDAEDKAPVFK